MKYSIILVLILSNSLLLCAQTNINQISVKFGVIENFQDDQLYQQYGDLDKTIPYPEISVGGNLATNYLSWSIFGGFWNDGISKQLSQVVDFITYSESANFVGFRISLSSDIFRYKLPLQTNLITGYSRHFVTHKPVGGFGYDGNSGEKFSSSFNALELGLSLGLKVWNHFNIFGEVDKYFLFDNDHQNLNNSKNAIRFGITYIY